MSGRLAEGGRIDRSRPLNFTFDGRPYQGYHGDTLASALLANGIRVVGRSFKYHRPRGIHGAGSEDPSALVRLGKGAFAEPNSRATQVELYDGLVAHSQNNWPTLNWDLSATLGLFSRFLPAGFYYKTFMWPAKLWPHYEHMIRRMAGMGQAPGEADPERYEKRHAHCDLLVIGGGSAGLDAASEAAAKGGDVWLVDEGSLEDLADVTVMGHTTAFGKYDDHLYGLVQHGEEHASENNAPRQILWLLRAERAVLATGAIERPLVFATNDRPGSMLTSAAITYLDT